MKKEVELAIKDVNSFINNKFQEWENVETENALRRYKSNEITWHDLHSMLKYKPLTYKQLSDIYNVSIASDNLDMIECPTQ